MISVILLPLVSGDTMQKTEQVILKEGFHHLITEIIDASFSADNDRLNRLVDSSQMRDVLQRRLGVETANFFCFDPYEKQVYSLHQAVPGALEMPFYRIDVEPGDLARFSVIRRSHEEIHAYRQLEKQVMGNPKQGGTVQKTLQHLREPFRFRSADEIERQWTLVTKGEIALYTFEWLVISGLEQEKVDSVEDAERLLLSSDFVEQRWRLVHDDTSGLFPHMLGRGLESYKAALRWLARVLQDRGQYAYLFATNHRSSPWFSRLVWTNKMVSELHLASRGKIDFGYLRQLACAIVRCGYADSRLTLDSLNQLIRFSPELVLHLGLHNVGVFNLTVTPGEGEEEPIEAFLLAGFYDTETCKRYFEYIKALFFALAQRDVFRFTRIFLARRTHELERQRDLLASIGGNIEIPTFVHELKTPVNKTKLYANKLIDAVDKADILEVRRNAELIRSQASKLMSVIKGLREAVKPGISSAETLLLAEEVIIILNQLKADLPNGVVVTGDFPENGAAVQFNRPALSVLLRNLVNNASEAMHGSGNLHVEVNTRRGEIVLVVEDSGPGVSLKRQKNIFNAFNTTKSEEDGVGLGLFICQQLVDRFGGKIYVESSQLGGARFVVKFTQAVNLEARLDKKPGD